MPAPAWPPDNRHWRITARFGHIDRGKSGSTLCRQKRRPRGSDNRDSRSSALAADKANFDPHAVYLYDSRLTLVIPFDALAVAHFDSSARRVWTKNRVRHREFSQRQPARGSQP